MFTFSLQVHARDLQYIIYTNDSDNNYIVFSKRNNTFIKKNRTYCILVEETSAITFK